MILGYFWFNNYNCTVYLIKLKYDLFDLAADLGH